MLHQAQTFSADDAHFDEGLRIIKPHLDEVMIRRGMDMACFTPHEILFYDHLRKKELQYFPAVKTLINSVPYIGKRRHILGM